MMKNAEDAENVLKTMKKHITDYTEEKNAEYAELQHILRPFLPRNLRCSLRAQRGQALLEMAIFGSLALMVLGVMISYGLNADYTQQAMMRNSREALAHAPDQPLDNRPASTSHLSIEDRRMVDPSNPYAIGQTVLISGSSSGVVRNYRMHQTGDRPDELPRALTTMPTIRDRQGKPLFLDCSGRGLGCATAGFRTERIPTVLLERYEFVYSQPLRPKAKDICLDTSPPLRGQPCQNPGKEVRILDSCEGEIINIDNCIKQALTLVDSQACHAECDRDNRRGGQEGRPIDCGVCNTPVPPEHWPWYARGAFPTGPARWTFPELEQMRDLGLQPEYARRTVGASQLKKLETPIGDTSPSSIRTWARVRVEETTARRFLYNKKSLDYVAQALSKPGAVTAWRQSNPCRPLGNSGNAGNAGSDVLVTCNDVDAVVDWNTVGR